jgi:hypothetical protein
MNQPILVPAEIAAAISAARPELLKLVKPRALTVEEAASLYDVIASLIRQSFEAQLKVERLLVKIAAFHQHAQDMELLARQLSSAAHVAFHASAEQDDDEGDGE